jgi:RNA polymerase sigma factor (sigma-70 family)
MPPDDELLAVRCQLGEPDAFAELIARWHEPLWRYTRRMTGSDEGADEAVQDVWLRVCRGLPGLRDGARLRAWVFGIARRVAMDRLRERYARPVSVEIDPEGTAAAADPGEDTEMELTVLRDQLEHLPLVEREVLALFYLEALTIPELADVLCVPAGTVKSRLFRARRLLRERMAAKGVSR